VWLSGKQLPEHQQHQADHAPDHPFEHGEIVLELREPIV